MSRTLKRIGIEIAVAAGVLIILLLLAAGASNRFASALMINRGPNGTFTIQKKPPNGGSKDSKAGSGLVIPPQVVVPLVPGTGKKP